MSQLSNFHYAEPLWLWFMLVPALLLLVPNRRRGHEKSLDQYADAHLLPHLIEAGSDSGYRSKTSSVVFLLFWLLGTLALAGPRWDFSEVDVYEPASSVVFLLDLSNSMNVSDAKPSRLERAKQEIEDVIKLNQHLRLGLIAFATVSHLVTPVSDDAQNMLNLLPSLNTGLITLQGSQLAVALERAQRLLESESAGQHAIVLLSDGDFEQAELDDATALLAKSAIQLHVVGVGTLEGAPVPDEKGNWLRDAQQQVAFSKLSEDNLIELARAGDGVYIRADYRDEDSQHLMQALENLNSAAEKQQRKTRIWEERFYILLVPMALIMMTWFLWPASTGARVKRSREV